MQSDGDVVIEVSDEDAMSELSISLLEGDEVDDELLKLQDLEISREGKGVKLTSEQREHARSGTTRTRSISSSAGSYKTGGKPDSTTLFAMQLAKEVERQDQEGRKVWNKEESQKRLKQRMKVCSKPTEWVSAKDANKSGKIAPSVISTLTNEVTSATSRELATSNQYNQVIVIKDADVEEITDKGQVIDDGHKIRQFRSRVLPEADFEIENSEQDIVDDDVMMIGYDSQEPSSNRGRRPRTSTMVTSETIHMGTSTDARHRIPAKEVSGRLDMSQEQQDNQRNEDLEGQEPISSMNIQVVDSRDVNIDAETLSEMDPEELKTIYIRGLQDNQLWGAYGKNYKSYIKQGQTECERHALCFCPPRVLMFDNYKVYTFKFENRWMVV